MLLKEMFEFSPKSKRSAAFGQKTGRFPFFTSSNIVERFVNAPDYSGEYLIIGDGGTGNCKYYKGEFSVSDHNYLLRPKKGTNAMCVKYFLMKDGYKVLNDGFKGVGIKNVSKKYIENIDYAYNKNFSENEIVTSLQRVESLIDEKNKQITELDSLAKSRFNEMFGKEATKKVGDICSSFKIGPFGSALHKHEIKDRGYAFVLGTDNAVKNDFAFDEIRYIDKEKYEVLEKYKAVSGDVIMSMMGTVGRVAVVPKTLGTAIISSHLCILRTNPQIMSPDFFQTAFSRDDDIQNQISGIQNGSIMNGFNLKIVKNFDMKCPSLERQGDFLNFKHLIDKSRFIVQSQIKDLQELLDSKMDEYFGGDNE